MSQTGDRDPRKTGPEPPFEPQEQQPPGRERDMVPLADHGYDSYRGHERLKGCVALITGGDSGIGRAVALAFAREGANVAFSHLSEEEEDAANSKAAVLEAGVDCLALGVELSDPGRCTELVARVVERFGRIDILVNNAAYQGKAVEDLAELDDERLEHTLRVNVLAPLVLVREAVPHMPPGSSIINVSSVQAYDPSPNILDYATTKGALISLTKALSQSLVERGIRVNAIAPGPVWTPLVVQSFDQKKNAHFGENSPMGRPAQPAELAPAFVFLASTDARYVNGEVLGVTGGRLLA